MTIKLFRRKMFGRNKKNKKVERKGVALITVDAERARLRREKKAREKREFMKFVVDTGNSFE